MCHQCAVLLTMVAKEGLCEEMTSNLWQGGAKALTAMRLSWPRNDKVTVGGEEWQEMVEWYSLSASLCAVWEGVWLSLGGSGGFEAGLAWSDTFFKELSGHN